MTISDCGFRKVSLRIPQSAFRNPHSAMEVFVDKEALKKRTKQFALRVIHLVEALPTTRTADIIGRQLLRSGTSVGANYRAACRAKSNADFTSKMGTVEEETAVFLSI